MPATPRIWSWGSENGTNDPGTPIDEPGDLIRFFDGAIDEFVIYDRALSQAEVQQLFEAGGRGLVLTGTAEDDSLIGGLDDEVLRGLEGNDDLRGGGGDDLLRGAGGQDAERGGPGGDRLHGGTEGDDLRGGNGADELFGGRASDVLRGGAGDDHLNGGPGSDNLIGGADADTFQIDRIRYGVDSIQDYSPDQGDILDLSAVLDFSGGDANQFVQLNEVNGNTNVAVNADGAGGDFTTVFRLVGTTGLNLDTLVSDGNVQLEQPTS